MIAIVRLLLVAIMAEGFAPPPQAVRPTILESHVLSQRLQDCFASMVDGSNAILWGETTGRAIAPTGLVIEPKIALRLKPLYGLSFKDDRETKNQHNCLDDAETLDERKGVSGIDLGLKANFRSITTQCPTTTVLQ